MSDLMTLRDRAKALAEALELTSGVAVVDDVDLANIEAALQAERDEQQKKIDALNIAIRNLTQSQEATERRVWEVVFHMTCRVCAQGQAVQRNLRGDWVHPHEPCHANTFRAQAAP